MSVAAVLHPVAAFLVSAADKTPKDEDVKAGWTAFAIFLLLIAAVVVLAFSFVKQLRKAQAAKDAGVYGDVEPGEAAEEAEAADVADEPPTSDKQNHSAS
jgi:flagellar biosynthesis/type III secretory pathway M-ring protein FliF/YscJ